MDQIGADPEERPAIRAIDHWLSGLLFAVILSAAVVFASYVPVVGRVFGAIEDSGVDAAMQARLWVAPRSPIGREVSGIFPRYVFVDLDTATCLAVEKSQWCVTRSPASPSATARVAVAVLAAHPKIIMLDVPLWDRSQSGSAPAEDFGRLVAAANANPGTRVIATAPSRPSVAPDVDMIDPTMLPEGLTGGEIKFAPAFGWNEGGVLRDYPATVAVQINGGGNSIRRTPTLPYLAALYAMAGNDSRATARIDCLAWPTRSGNGAPCAAVEPSLIGTEVANEGRPLFTLPHLPPQGAPPSADNARYWGLYDHYLASDVVGADGALRISPSALQDKIVVIGASSANARDDHVTPVGAMSGAEVIMNVTRAYFAGAVPTKPSLLGTLWREALIAAIGSLPFLLFWWFAFTLGDRIERRTQRLPPAFHGALAAAPAVVLFVPAIVASAALMITFAFTQLNVAFLGGHTWDLFTPLAALSLEGFTHASTHVMGVTEGFAVRVRQWACRPLVKRSPKVQDGDDGGSG